MKSIQSYGLTYKNDGRDHDEIFFTKKELVLRYLSILGSGTISHLAAYQIEGVRSPQKKDITNAINRFLAL